MQADVNIKATDGHSALQGAQVVRPLTVSEYPPLDTTVIWRLNTRCGLLPGRVMLPPAFGDMDQKGVNTL